MPLRDGALALGRYQAIFLCEFDGPKPRSVYVSVLRRHRRPLVRLRLRTSRLELRLPATTSCPRSRRSPSGGIHPPEFDAVAERRGADACRHAGVRRRVRRVPPGTRARSGGRTSWDLILGVWARDEPAGVQDVARPGLRRNSRWSPTPVPGSAQRFQGQGYGTEMRHRRARAGLRAGWAPWRPTSGCVRGQRRRRCASRTKLGYVPDGRGVLEPRGERRRRALA